MNRSKRSRQPYQIQGVDALFGSSSLPERPEQRLPLSQLSLPRRQPRRYFDAKSLQELVESVKLHGILQPLLVRPVAEETYEVVAGERRYRAAVEADLTEVPVIIRQLNEQEAWQLALLENLQREDLNPLEETEGILQLLELKLALPQEAVIELLSAAAHPERAAVDNVIHSQQWQELGAVFQSIGKFTPESFRTNRLPLLKLPTELLEVLRKGEIAYTKARAIAQVKDDNFRKELLDKALAQSLSLSEIRELIKVSQSSQPNEDFVSRFGRTYKRMKKSLKALDNPKKRKKLESLLAQIEELIAEEN